ncbi:MAG: glycosyltransferase [Polyangiaceae bacterium]
MSLGAALPSQPGFGSEPVRAEKPRLAPRARISGIRSRRAGRAFEREPRVRFAERALLAVFVVAGVYSLLFFAEYWFASQHQRAPLLFWLLSFAVCWNPLCNVYNWWVYLWAEHPLDVSSAPPPLHPDTKADVLMPCMPGEPFSMIELTLRAIRRLSYLGDAFLLDGGNDPKLVELCNRLGVVHVNCKNVGGAKAGKVNHCLKYFSTAEFALVIDPDHIPRTDFLARVLPWFSEARVGFVQVVQAYYNLRDNWVAWGAGEQTFGFYGPTLMGLNGLGIPTAIGANCTFRRSALDAIGGHAEHLAEDALTSMRMHAAGYTSVYLPYRASEGLVPTDLNAFWKQQLKWATGMTYLLFQEYPKLFLRFSAACKLHYGVSCLYYLRGVVGALTLSLPALFLLLHVHAVELPLAGFLWHVAPYALSTLVINTLVQRWYSHREERGLPWRSLLLEKATWHIYLLGFVYGAVGRKVPYLPTPKDGGGRLPFRSVWPHWLLLLLSLCAVAAVPLTYQRIEAGTSLMIGLSLANSLLLLPAALACLRGPVQKAAA